MPLKNFRVAPFNSITGLALLNSIVLMDYIESGSALRQLTLKPFEFRAVLAAGRHICRKEEKQNALGGIRTSYLLITVLMG